MPNPVPNELLLMFSGYLSFKGLLFLPYVVITALSADFIGTNILYFLFYNTGTFIIQRKPRWFPLSSRTIERLTTRISRGGQLSIFIFRLTPFTRGYTSVITGLLQVKPILAFRDGQTEPVEQQRTKRRAIARLCELVLDTCPRSPESYIKGAKCPTSISTRPPS